ncbi:hypothetical protein F7734_20985 [Scytonema sp. UIC 10036]|uniref:hypothetical protein n=1 Tax=Scytonema sp. UIC 10036 TaxID=2304196 RepID=UPI0012DA3A2A|nr:hypothetical protein [Scytonema sp. UIC 10036]MUG94703.1 hypothetical protein [Scytonema sp. UIC 10036]
MFDTKLWLQLSAILFVGNIVKIFTNIPVHVTAVFVDTAMNIVIPTLACIYVSLLKKYTVLYQNVYYEPPYVVWAETGFSWAVICCVAILSRNLSPGFAIATFSICLCLAMALRRR